jgi:hypothetical protein
MSLGVWIFSVEELVVALMFDADFGSHFKNSLQTEPNQSKLNDRQKPLEKGGGTGSP